MPKASRGEVWLVDLGLAAKVRPCLVVSVTITDADRALVTFASKAGRRRGAQHFTTRYHTFRRPGRCQQG